MSPTISSYRDLVVWQKAIQLAIEIYQLTDQFPREEQFGLVSQMRRAAVSIASNIAEGRSRGTRKDFMHFLTMAYASGAELETQIYIARQLPKTHLLDYQLVESIISEIMKMLNRFIQSLKNL